MPKFTHNDITLHYELDGTGQPVVYICGFSDHSNSVFSTGVRGVLSEQYQVLNVDNRGSGQTVVGDGATAMIDDMADDVAAIMDEHDIKIAHVLGFSMGGGIAMTLALRHPEKVRSLVVVASLASYAASSMRNAFLLQTTAKMRAQSLPSQFVARYTATYLLGESIFQHERFIEAWVNAPEDPLRQTQDAYKLQREALETFDIRDQLPSIRVPTLVVSSPEDILLPPRFQDEIAELIPGSVIKRYPGGHVFMGLRMVNAPFYEDVFAFLAQHS